MIKVIEIKIIKEAVNDLKNSKVFYNNQKMGLGDYFWNSIIKDIESLNIYAGIQKKFPYSIYYYISNKIAYVVAILPMKIDPERIDRILFNRN